MTLTQLKQKRANRKKYLRRKGKKNGWLTLREAAELKGVSFERLQKNILRFKQNSNCTKIKYDVTFINYKFRNN